VQDHVDTFARALASVPFAVAVLVITTGLVRAVAAGRGAPARIAASVGLGLEFLLAAGLLRLSAVDDLEALGAVAAIVVLRKVITAGLRFGVQALEPARRAPPPSST